MAALAVVLLVLLAGLSLFFVAVGLPGLWLLLGAVLLCVGVSPHAAVTPGMVGALACLAVLAEAVEFLCTYFGARRYGVSPAGTWAGVAGGILGAILLGSAVPVVGAVPGAFAGTFLGAFGAEMIRGGSRAEATRQGWGAFMARVLASIAKLSVGLAMAVLGLFWLV